VDVVIQTLIEHSADFKRSLYRFLDTHVADQDDGFTIHWTEPQGDCALQHVRFESVAAAEAFQSGWRSDGAVFG